jgi:hypothetical protein
MKPITLCFFLPFLVIHVGCTFVGFCGQNELWYSASNRKQERAAMRLQKESSRLFGLPIKKDIITPDGTIFSFVLVPAGICKMGNWEADEGSSNKLEGQEKEEYDLLKSSFLTRPSFAEMERPFYMQKTEVTQQQWYSVMGEWPSHFSGVDLPVETVSFRDV